MGCTNQKLHGQQIAYQRDFLGACWNSSLGEDEADEYLASRWMGVSKSVMALYTNNHCFIVRTLNKDEKARTDAAASGKPALKAADDPTGLAPGFGGDLGGGGGGVQTSSPAVSSVATPSTSTLGKQLTFAGSYGSPYAPFSEKGQSSDFIAAALNTPQSSAPPPLPRMPSKPVVQPAAHTTMRQATGHSHAANNNSVTTAIDEHNGFGHATSTSLARPALSDKVKRNADSVALRNVVKDSMESERVVHANHPYLQRHGLSVYGGVVFRCAPAHRLYHRISLVPEANVKRLYDMQVTAMSRNIMYETSSSMIGPPGSLGYGHNEIYHHFQPGASSMDYPRLRRSSEGDEPGVLPLTPHMPPRNIPSMVPSPMIRPLSRPHAAAAAMESSVSYANVPLLGSSLDQPPLPSVPLGAVPARHLRFASGPGTLQSAVIDTWATENPLSTFNNYPFEDRDVAGVTASQPPVIIGSVTAMELQALPPNAEVCFGGWLYVSLQDEQERLRKSLKRYVARRRRQAAKAAAEDATSPSTAPRSRRTSQRRRNGNGEDHDGTFGVDEADIELEDSLGNVIAPRNRTSSTIATPPAMPVFHTGTDVASPSSDSVAAAKGSNSGVVRALASGMFTSVASRTMAPKDSDGSSLPRVGDNEGDNGEGIHESTSDDLRDPLNRTTVFAKSTSADVSTPTQSGARTAEEDTNNGDSAAASSQRPAPKSLPDGAHVDPLTMSIGLQASRSAVVAPLRMPSRTPSRLRPRASSVPLSPLIGPSNNPAMLPPPPPLRHAGRYAREAMEADTLHASWLPYAYIIVGVPMYECSLVPTTYHTAFTRHKAVSLNLGNAQSRQAYGVGCITGVRYGGVMVIEYRDKIDDEEDAEWIAKLIRVGKLATQGLGIGDDDDDEAVVENHVDLSASMILRHSHHSAPHRARAEKLRRIKSRIWHKLRRQGLHVVLAATRMADRHHRQQRASVASEVSNLFSNSYVDAAAAVMGASHTPQHFAANVRRTTSALQNLPSSNASAHRNSLAASRTGYAEQVRNEHLGVDEGGIGAGYGNGAGGGAEELNEAMEDAVEDLDSTNSSVTSDSDSSSNAFSRPSCSDSERRGRGSSLDVGSGTGGSSGGGKKTKGQWWRLPSSRRRHRRRHGGASGENDLGSSMAAGGGKGNGGGSYRRGRSRSHQRHRRHRHRGTTREDRLRWADPQMTDDFFLRGTFRQIGGMKYLDAVSLMDGCPVSELVQGIKRWVVNLLSMPIKARPICLFLQRYEGIAASLRVIQTQLTATALASNVASGKQLAQGNLSFHIASSGLPATNGSFGGDETVAYFASQHMGDPTMDPITPFAALVNASFTALQAPMPSQMRTLAYHTCYCGPLEPKVRAVLSPELEAMITSCQTRQLPDVLRSQGSRAALTDTQQYSDTKTSDPLPPPPRELVSSKRSTLFTTNANTTTLLGSPSNVQPAPAATYSPPPATTAVATAAAAAPAHNALSDHSTGPLSPDLGPSKPAFSMPQCVEVSSKLSQLSHPSAAVPHSSPPSTVVHADVATVVAHTPHGSFAAPSVDAKTTGACEAADAAAHVKPPANTVPTTITEFLLYDDPTKKDKVSGNSFSEANGQALAAAAAALILAENVKGPAAVSNASLAAPSVNTGSFSTVHPLGNDSMMEAPPSVHGGSFDRPMRGVKNAGMEAARIDDSFILEDPEMLRKRGQASSLADKAKMRDPPTDTYSKENPVVRPASPGTIATPQHQQLLLPAAQARNCDHANSSGSRSSNSDSFNNDEEDEKELEWQLADRELRALKSELDEMTHLASTARSELLDRLEELIQLGSLFLPHTRPDQMDLCLITMKMLRQYPEEVPVKEIHTDWVPQLMTLLTSSRENLFCSSGCVGGDLSRTIGNAHGFLKTYNNIVDASDMCDANKRREACDAGITKYMVDPLPPMPAPRRLHDIVIAPQPVRFTSAMLQEMKRIGMDRDGLSFSFSGGSLGVLAGVLYYYSDFLRAKYHSEVAAVGGRAKDAGATVLDVLSRGGYNVLLRRIWIWGVTPESKKSSGQKMAMAPKKLLQKRWTASGDDAHSSGGSNSNPPTPLTVDEHDHVTMNTASVGGSFIRAVGRPFRGTEAFALYDAIAHYLRTLEELLAEHNGNNTAAPQAPVKRRSVLMAWRRSSKDNSNDPCATTTHGGGGGGNAELQSNGPDGFADEVAAGGARDLVPTFEVCVASNYYYKRMLDEAHWPARSRTGAGAMATSGGGGGAGHHHRHSSAAPAPNGDATRHSSAADVPGKLPGPPAAPPVSTTNTRQQKWSRASFSEKAHSSPTVTKPGTGAHEHAGGAGSRDESSVLEKPYCGGEEMEKKNEMQRRVAKKFYSFLSDHYEQWRARHSEDRATTALGKRIIVSMN
jgi:hypothetical protein